ncbi:hypothetical protein QJR60_06225 [Paraclostridium sordellii]|uniref:hypothetical protein n=1 Tax=Paraclostridium sordellii TaxID=1505 RepID=UPI00070F03E4
MKIKRLLLYLYYFYDFSKELRPFNKEIPKSEIGIEISKLPINPSIDIIITKTANSILNNFIV